MLNLLLGLVDAFHLVAVEVADGVSCHCVALLLVSGYDGVAFLHEAQYLVLDGGKVHSDVVVPVAYPVAPAQGKLYARILDGAKVSDTRYGARDARHFGQQVFGFLLVVHPFKVQAVAEEVGFCTGFPGFHLLPAQVGVGQVGKLVARVDGGRGAEHGGVGIRQQRFGGIGAVQVLVAQCAPRAFQFQHVQPGDVLHPCFLAHQPAQADGVEVLPLVAGVGEGGRTVAAVGAVEQVLALVVVEHACQHGHGGALPLRTAVGGGGCVTDTYVPFVGIVRNDQAYPLGTGAVQILELVVVGGETGCGRHAVVSPGVGVGQQIVALYLHFRFFGLGHSGLAVAQRGYVSLDACVIYLDNRGVCPCAVRGIVQGEHGLELEVFQEIPLPVHVARATVVLGFRGIRLQVYVHHRVVHLCLLESGQ